MWLPETAQQVRDMLASGGLEETATFDGKQGQPKSPDLVVDVGAMTVAGGVLLFGVSENEQGTRITGEDPIELADQRERVQGMVATGLSEPPRVISRALELPEDPGRGFLIVHVLQSARAPHQIVLKGKYEGRFYTRDATGNRILTQPEIELLYARRQRWERDLTQEVREQADRYRPRRELDGETIMTIVAEPVSVSGPLLRASQAGDPSVQLRSAVQAAIAATPQWRSDMGYFDGLLNWRLVHADAWHAESLASGDVAVLAEASRNGRLDLSTNTVGDERDGLRSVSSYYVAGMCARAVALAGQITAHARFMGVCDIGVYLGPLAGVRVPIGGPHGSTRFSDPYGKVDYVRTTQVPATSLHETPAEIARELLAEFFEATVGTGVDLFTRE